MPAPGTGDAAEGDPAAVPVELSTPSRRLLPGKHPTSGPNYRQELFCEIPNPHGTAQIGNRFIFVAGCSSPLSPSLPPNRAASAGLEKPSMELEQMG